MAHKESANLMGKAKGAARKAASYLTGQPGILATLKQEHAEVAGLMDKISATKGKPNISTERLSLFEQLRRELLAHAHGEEKQFYPRLLQFTETESLVKESFADHKQLEELIDELTRLEETDPAWMDTFGALRDNVLSHVEEEETVLFPKVEGVLDADDLRVVEQAYLRQKKTEIAAFS